MEAFEKLMSFFMSQKCYEDIFYDFNLTNIDCLKMIISKGLGYGILAGSLLLKVPQILKILTAKSGQGISVLSEVLFLIAIFGSMSYGFYKQYPIAAYGDSYFLYIQGIIILLLVLYYQKSYFQILVSIPIISLFTIFLFANMLPESVILTLNGLTMILSVVSKLNQAYLNFRNSSTGALSPITLILQLLGTVARIFTSIQETGDVSLIITYVVVSIANGLLVWQLYYYWNSKSVDQAKKSK